MIFICSMHLSINLKNNNSYQSQFLVWNIGQGQWVTYIKPSHCVHFDVGGEWLPPTKKLTSFCGGKTNIIALSHIDKDHIRFSSKVKTLFLNTCFMEQDFSVLNIGPKKQRQINKLKPHCQSNINDLNMSSKKKLKQNLLKTLNKPTSEYSPKKANSWNQVFLHNGFLFPGDSTKKSTSKWTSKNKALISSKTNWAMAIHHGSHTNISQAYWKQLNPNMSLFVSSRKNRYGHPHKKWTQSAKKHHINYLRTEDWGHIQVLL